MFTLPKSYVFKIGLAGIVLSNPILYLTIGALLIDLQNIFGTNIDRRSISFNTDDLFIQAMNLIAFISLILLTIGFLKTKRTIDR